jgi:hypothetical protein
MAERVTKITLTETDTGFRFEVDGKQLKDFMSCCCVPFCIPQAGTMAECCPPPQKKEK